jgi:YfiH family protein
MIVMTAILPESAPGFHWTPVPWGFVLRCDALHDVAPHFFTARELRLRGEDEVTTREWESVAREIGVRAEELRRMRQVHGCAVVPLSSHDHPSSDPPQADGIVSADPAVALVVQVADCVPLLIADSRTGIVSATHAGWRGAAANIAGATVRHLVDRFAIDPADLVAAIGPSIGPCCYQVGPDVKATFLAGAVANVDTWFRPDPNDPGGDRLKLDMWQANRDQLIAAGLRPDRVHVARLCTASHPDRFHSYRLEGASAGRLIGVIRSRGLEPGVEAVGRAD